MCLATVYKEKDSGKEKICENISYVEFDNGDTILTDILNRKTVITAHPKTMDLSAGIIIF